MTSSGVRTSVRLVAVGDLLLGDTPVSVGFGFASRYPGMEALAAFGQLRDLLAEGDIRFGNLECPLAARSGDLPNWHLDQLRGDPEYAEVLASLGFTVLSVANNHAGHHGRAAFEGTLAALDRVGIHAVGLAGSPPWACDPVIVPSGDPPFRVGFLAYSWRPPVGSGGNPGVATAAPEAVAADIRRLRPQVDALIVSLHWGEDFVATPSKHETEIAHGLVEAGADVVLGHHSQVLRPVERRGKAVIAYGLGSLVGDHIWYAPMRTGAVLHLELGAEGVEDAAGYRTHLDGGFQPIPGPPYPLPRAAGALEGLSEEAYAREASRAARHQRAASYLHAIRNARRYPPPVLRQLLGNTLGNRWSRLRQLGAGGSRP